MRAELASGASVEIAGYAITPALANAIAAVDLARFADAPWPTIDWTKRSGIGSSAVRGQASTAARASADLCRRVQARTAVAQQFWGTTEIVVPDAFLDQTERIVRGWTRVESPA